VRDGKVLASSGKKTKPKLGPEAVIERIAETVKDVMVESEAQAGGFRAVCVGAPGTIDPVSGIVRHAPNLGWEDVPLASELSRRVQLPVYLDNDVNVGVIGEHVYGAGRGCLNLAAIFVGTGIGGGIVFEGRPYTGVRGAAAEFGHTVIEPKGRPCGCGRRGCAEAYASKTAMEAMIRERVDKGRTSVVPGLLKEKGKSQLTSSVVERALEQGDEVMREVMEIAQRYLSILVANVVNALDPEMVVFGGGIVERLGDSFVDPIARGARKRFILPDEDERVRIVPGLLGDHAATIGAAVEAQRRS
jgi:glucokinase